MKKYTFLTVILLLIGLELSAQSFYQRKRERLWIAGFGTGTASYFGDINAPNNYLDLSPSITVSLERKLSDHLALRAEAVWYRISGSDEEAGVRPNEDGVSLRNLSFRSDNLELSVSGKAYLFPNNAVYYRRNFWNAYAFLGVGVTYFDPVTNFEGEWVRLRPLETEGVSYAPVTMVIPLGLGVKFAVTPFINISVEGGYRFTFTDYLDDVSGRYRDPNEFPGGFAGFEHRIADRKHEITSPGVDPGDLTPADFLREGDIRGNPDNDDGYFLLNVKVEYFISPTIFQQKRRAPRPGKKARYR